MKKEELAFWLDLKALMEHAIFHQQGGSRMDMRFAINHAHQAVELTMRKKAELLGKNPWDFPKLIKALDSGGVKIPYKRQIEELNKARTLTQHYGTTPNDNDARRLVFIARDFLIDFWKGELDIDYNSISLVDLIQNGEVRNVLKDAEAAKTHTKRIEKSVLATYLTRWWIESGFYEDEPIATGIDSIDVVEHHEVSDALDSILNIALSNPFAYRLKKLRSRTGIVFLQILGGKPIMQKLKSRRLTKQDALEALELAVEYATWAESVYS